MRVLNVLEQRHDIIQAKRLCLLERVLDLSIFNQLNDLPLFSLALKKK